jgi:cytidyltransferase-like protein
MIVATADLPRHSGRVAMVDGGFDPLHAGHIDYFEAAAALGPPVLCNVGGDHYVARKHPPVLPERHRVRVIDAIRFIDFTHLSGTTTEEVLRILRPRMYVKGSDWRDRLPAGEQEVCREMGIEIVYLDTVSESSSRLLERFLDVRTQEGPR